jgi:hypothetical protein
LQFNIFPVFALDAIMFAVLVVVTGRLARSDQRAEKPQGLAVPPAPYQPPPMPAVTGGAAS